MEKLKLQFVQIGRNCWEDCIPDEAAMKLKPNLRGRSFSAHLAGRFDKGVWRRLLKRISENGLNGVLIDLADAIKYQRRPEIGLEDGLSCRELRDELNYCRDLGLEPLPKLNFSSCHDAWLKSYERMLSTPIYYECCRDLIEEVCELFDGPRFFHLGMDEENYPNQAYYQFVAIRQGALWWHDMNFLAECVRNAGSRAWVWSDKLWDTPAEEFLANMPHDVIQSNWYYARNFSTDPAENKEARCVEAYLTLARAGYLQIPCGSNLSGKENYISTVEFCEKNIPDSVIGYLMAPWGGTGLRREGYLMQGADAAREGNMKILRRECPVDLI